MSSWRSCTAVAISAVAVLLTTRPSGKGDGWNRGAASPGDAEPCASGVSLCAVLARGRPFGAWRVEAATSGRWLPCPSPLRVRSRPTTSSRRRWTGRYGKLFDDYLLMRKFYVRGSKATARPASRHGHDRRGLAAHLLDGQPHECGLRRAHRGQRCWPETTRGPAGPAAERDRPARPARPCSAFMVAFPSEERRHAFAADPDWPRPARCLQQEARLPPRLGRERDTPLPKGAPAAPQGRRPSRPGPCRRPARGAPAHAPPSPPYNHGRWLRPGLRVPGP